MSAQVRSGDVLLDWDAAARIAIMRFAGPGAVATTEDARVTLAALETWAKEAPVRLLVDCAGLSDADAGWRSAYASFFRGRGGRIAWFNMSPLIRMMVRMFVLATSFPGRGFSNEPEARAWLLGEGA